MELVALAECLCQQLTEFGAGPVCWCGVYPGAQISWEGCSDCGVDRCGMGWVRLVQAFPYEVFPTPTVDGRCQMPLAFAVEVGALRCFPQPTDGEPPDPAMTTEAAVMQMYDARAMYNAIKCCSTSVSMAVQGYVPVGPAGGCVGGYWTAIAPIDSIG